MKKINVEYALKDLVRIRALNTIGRVWAVNISRADTQFQVRYFWNGKIEEVWFFAAELESVPVETKSDV